MNLNFQQDIEASLQVLRSGGVILYPTDTIWGLGCDATNDAAVKRVFEIKKRPDEKAMIVLLAEPGDINNYLADPDPGIFDYLEKIEKPTTIIYDNALHFSQQVIADDGSVAIRIVREEFCKHLIKRFRKPIISTSANISGEPTPTAFASISEQIKQAADYVVQYRQDEKVPKQTSSLVRWNRDGSVTMVRP